MVKKHTTLVIDDAIIENMKENKLNMSEVAERAFRERLGEVVLKPTQEICAFCGDRVNYFASAENPNEGLMWLCPDEKWICQKCLRIKIKNVSATVNF